MTESLFSRFFRRPPAAKLSAVEVVGTTPAPDAPLVTPQEALPPQTEETPWWVQQTPEQINTSNLQYHVSNNMAFGTCDVKFIDENGKEKKAKVFAKVFDPNDILGVMGKHRDLESQRLWSEDAPHQRELRKRYQAKYPNEPIPILYSAQTREQNGLPTIIQEVAPEKLIYDILKDTSLEIKTRREIYFSALKQYCQFVFVGLEYGREIGFYTFGDQKGTDLRWDAEKGRLVILDIQRIKPRDTVLEEKEAFDTTQWTGIEMFQPKRFLSKDLLTEEETKIWEALERKRSAEQINTQELFFLYYDFALGKLKSDDPRLELTEKAKSVLLEKERQQAIAEKIKSISPDLYFSISGMELGTYTRTISHIDEDLQKSNLSEEAVNFLRLLRTLGTLALSNADGTLETRENSARIFNLFKSYIAGTLNKDETIALKDAVSSALTKYLKKTEDNPERQEINTTVSSLISQLSS